MAGKQARKEEEDKVVVGQHDHLVVKRKPHSGLKWGFRWGASPNPAPNSIRMILVDLDVHQIVGYHYL